MTKAHSMRAISRLDGSAAEFLRFTTANLQYAAYERNDDAPGPPAMDVRISRRSALEESRK